MRTITFATTQMNLINCVEYLSTVDGEHTLVIDSASVARKKQMLRLMQNNAYSRFFTTIICRTNNDNRILDFFNTIVYVVRLLLHSRHKYNQVISGNYLCFGSRIFYSALSKRNHQAKYIACDDGTGTVTVANKRFEEIESNRLMMYVPNRIFKKVVYKHPQNYIPASIVFFTNYEISPCKNDSVIQHNYPYLKQNLDSFNIDTNSFDYQVIVLGEPLYFKGFVSRECYAEKLKLFAKTSKREILYYAHPEETLEKWEQLEISEGYKYMDNILPFEIVAAILPDNCRVATFVSSVLMNIRIVNDKLQPECIQFNEKEVLPSYNYENVLRLYGHYKSIGVTFYAFN